MFNSHTLSNQFFRPETITASILRLFLNKLA